MWIRSCFCWLSWLLDIYAHHEHVVVRVLFHVYEYDTPCCCIYSYPHNSEGKPQLSIATFFIISTYARKCMHTTISMSEYILCSTCIGAKASMGLVHISSESCTVCAGYRNRGVCATITTVCTRMIADLGPPAHATGLRGVGLLHSSNRQQVQLVKLCITASVYACMLHTQKVALFELLHACCWLREVSCIILCGMQLGPVEAQSTIDVVSLPNAACADICKGTILQMMLASLAV